jgi:RNA polymerase subunit RPABC4/transcription elongation factor Spt4
MVPPREICKACEERDMKKEALGRIVLLDGDERGWY